MRDLIWLSEARLRRIERYFPLSHAMQWDDDRRIISISSIVIRKGLGWHDAPADYGPAKTVRNRPIRMSRKGRRAGSTDEQ